MDCGIGRVDQIPFTLSGNVALLRMSTSIAFGDALGNVIRAHPAGIVVINSEARYYYSTVNPAGVAPPIASVGSDDAERLTPGCTVHLAESLGDYKFGGTWFAAPHVAGVVALLRSLAHDAGATGRDDSPES